MSQEENYVNAVKFFVNKANDYDENDCFQEEDGKNLLQTVDLSDVTFSSFNDILLGDCSYFEDVSVGTSNNDFIEKTQTDDQNSTLNLFNKSSNESINLKDCINENSCKSDNNSMQNNLEQKVNDLMKNDNYDFYHVFELIDKSVNPVTQSKGLEEKSPIKSHKSSKKGKKRKGVTAVIRKGQRYLPNFKRKVLEYASNHTFKATALHFNINCNTITEWTRENKRLSKQQKIASMPDSISQYKTEMDYTPAAKTDIILLNDTLKTETEISEGKLKLIEQDLPLGEMRCDERFVKWIQNKREENRKLSRNEVYYAARHCLKRIESNENSPLWFVMWLKRYDKVLQCSDDKTEQETEKYIMYPSNFKLEVALYAKLFTKNSAARVFNVPRRRIFDWFKNSRLDYVNDDGCSEFGDVLRGEYEENGKKTRRDVYVELHDWYKKRFSNGFSPTSNEIKAKARELFTANGIGSLKFSEGWLQKFCKRLNIKLRYTDDDQLLLWILTQFDNNVSLSHQEITEKSSKLIRKKKEFKGSKGWTLRFLKRHSKFLQQVPTVEDKLPEIVQSEISEFNSRVRSALITYKVNIGMFGCMDEIPICFNYLEDGKPANMPLLRKTGFENCQAIVFLCALADGRLLPPVVVLRGNGGKQILSEEGTDTLIFYQEHGVVDCDMVENWILDCWLRNTSTPSLLIMDSFDPHSSPKIKEQLSRENSMLFVIPEGCSSQLQPLAVEIAPRFRDLMRKQWMEQPSNDASYSGQVNKRCRCPDQDTILYWIRNAHRKLEENPVSIMNSFKVVGLVD